MPAPRAVICELCGGKFFKSSLPIHQKTCRQKVGVKVHDCPYCGAGVPMLEMDAHILKCPDAKAAGAKPTGASAALARRLDNDRKRVAAGLPHPSEVSDERGLGGGSGDQPSEYAEGEDVRIACQVCGRKFAMDRIGKHQMVCEKIASKKPRRQFKVQREYCEGGSSGRVIGVGSTSSSKPEPLPAPKTNWREASKTFRDAMKAAREYPMPQWGDAGGSPGRSGGRSNWGGSPSPAPRSAQARSGPVSPTTSRNAAARSQSRNAPPTSAPSRGRGGDSSRSLSPPAGETAASRRRIGAPTEAAAEAGGSPRAQASRGPSDEAEIDALKQQFHKLDTNKDGKVDLRELSTLLRAGNPRMADRQMRLLFDKIDQDHNGKVDFDEFVDYVYTCQNTIPGFPGGLGSSGRTSPAAGSGTAAVRQTRAISRPNAVAGRRGAGGGGGGGARQPPLPEWGSNAPSRYGRDCMTSPPPRSSPHNTSLGGCSSVSPPPDPGGMQSNRASAGNPLAFR